MRCLQNASLFIRLPDYREHVYCVFGEELSQYVRLLQVARALHREGGTLSACTIATASMCIASGGRNSLSLYDWFVMAEGLSKSELTTVTDST